MSNTHKKLRAPAGGLAVRLDPAVLDRFLKGLALGPSADGRAGARTEAPDDAAEAAGVLLRSALPEAAAKEFVRRMATVRTERPRWVVGVQELWWAGRMVKCFCHVAGSQTGVLAAFQAAGWPRRIDDPLPALTGRKDKNRRRETIKSLNRGLMAESIRFLSDGTGGGICWEQAPGLYKSSHPTEPPTEARQWRGEWRESWGLGSTAAR